MTPAPKIGEGIFLSSEAAAILKLDKNKVRNFYRTYMREEWGSAFSVDGKHFAVNFLSMMEMYVFYRLRELGVSAQKLRKVHGILAEEFETDHPFAHRKLFTDGKDLFIGQGKDIVNAHNRQVMIEDVLMPFCEKVFFNREGIAERFYPDGQKSSVVVNPKVQFGSPTIEGTRVTTETLVNMHKAGDSIELLAGAFLLTKKQVKDAIAYAA